METEKVITDVAKIAESKVKNALKAVEEITITNDEELERAATVLTNVKKLSKWIKDEKEKVLKPLREATSAARAIFAPMEEGIEGAEGKLKIAMGAYHDKVEKERQKKEASIAARAEKGQLKEETAIRKMEELGETKTNVKTEHGSASFKKVKAVRVTNALMVPRQYFEINMVAVRRDALATGKLGEVIPGVEVYEETSVAAIV